MPCRALAALLALLVVPAARPLPAQSSSADSASAPPVAAVRTKVDTVAGVEWPDPYAWLRDDQRRNPDVLAHLRAENAYTERMTRHSRSVEARLFREMVARIKETDLSVPELKDGYYYYSRTVKGRQYPIFCRRRGSLSAPEEVLLDENALGQGHGYSRVGLRRVSPDGHLLAFTHDTTGSEWYTVRVKDLRAGKLLADAIDSVSYGLEWAADSHTCSSPATTPPTVPTASIAESSGHLPSRSS
jgi:oligopeptidase B